MWSLLNCLRNPSSAQVLHALGKGDDQKVAMVKALQDYANMIKVSSASVLLEEVLDR